MACMHTQGVLTSVTAALCCVSMPQRVTFMLQVALKAVQRRLNSHSTGMENATEIQRLQGALDQASLQYKQLLEQFTRLQEKAAALSSSAQSSTQLQAANAVLVQDFERSQAQFKRSEQQLQQSQEQLRQHMQKALKMQQLVENLSKAAADMHSVVEQAEISSQAQSASNLRAVHDTVHNKLSRHESHSSDSDFSSSELLLPTLWKPQRERHIAPTGF